MKTIKIIGLLAGLTVATSSLFSGAASAATGNLFLTPSTGSYNNGTTFTVTVHENADNVNVVTAKMTYEASKLSCEGVGGSSAFPQNIAASCSGGNITISRYTASDANGNPTTVSGDQVVGTVTFKALVGSGTTAVNFAAGSQIASNGSNVWNGGTTGGTYTLTTPAPVTGGQGGGSSEPVASGSATPNNSTASNTTANNNVATANGTTPATTSDDTTATGDVKSDATKKDAAKKADTTKNTAAKKSGHTVWPWVILILIGAAAIAYGVRNNRKAIQGNSEAVVSGAKPKADKAAKVVAVAAPVAAAKKAAAPAKKPANKNNKNAKKSGKKSR
jgi:hypothetical protein